MSTPPPPPAQDPLSARMETVDMNKRITGFLTALGKNAFVTVGWQVPDGSLSVTSITKGLDPLLVVKGMSAGMNNYVQQIGASAPPAAGLPANLTP